MPPSHEKSGLAVVNLAGGSRQRELQQKVSDLYLLMQTASEQAVLNNREYGFLLTDGGYRFVAMNDDTGKWETFSERIFRPRTFPAWIIVTSRLEADIPRLPSSNQANVQPEIVFLSSGETTPFELVFSLKEEPDVRHVIYSDGISPMVWQQPGEITTQ